MVRDPHLFSLVRHTRQKQFYPILAELVRRHQEPPPTPGGLAACELSLFSQNGEGGVVAELLRRIGGGPRYFIEFGVEAGREGNCVFLADVMGWTGLFMEADHVRYNGLAWKYRGNPRIDTRRAFVTAANINDLLADAGVPDEPDILSIDVDGNDFWIWAAIKDIRPRIVIVEYNSHLHPRSRLVQPYAEDWAWDGTSFQGASIGALRWLGERKGYRFVHSEIAGVNAFFIRDDLLDCLADLDLEAAPLRSPNYWLTGEGHPPDPQNRQYIDLDQVDAAALIAYVSGRS